MAESCCPTCGSLIKINQGFIAWCVACNWNVNPIEPPKKKGKPEQIYEKLGKKYGQSLLNTVIKEVGRPKQMTVTKAVLFIFCALIHAVGFAAITLSIFLLAHYKINGFTVVSSLLIVSFGVYWLPKPTRKPKNILDPKRFPETYKQVNEVAGLLGAKKVSALIFNGEWNASISEYGFTRKVYMTIGLPLWEVLSQEERVALLSHEFGHKMNLDLSWSFFIVNTFDILSKWYDALLPVSSQLHENSMFSLIMLPVRAVLKLCSYPILWLFYLLVHLYWQDSQRAEYYADAAALKLCSN